MSASTTSALERETMARVSRRLVPFLMLCYFIAYLDRVNVGFAALEMNKALGLSPTAYAWGAGIFFLAYFLFEVPSNVILEKVGARRWIARIMITWGILSGCMALVQGEWSLYLVRFLLGIAEAGFFPGIILYLTYWFPATYRAGIVGAFMVAIPISTVIGAPISGMLLGLHGVMGLDGWQWLFIIEAVPAVLLSGVVLFYLTDKPADAQWLEPAQREWLANRLEQERQSKEAVVHFTLGEALRHPRVIGLGLVYFGVVAANYGLSFWLPQIVKGFGLSNLATGFVTAIPYAFGAVAMVLWGRSSDRTGERVWHTAGAAILAAAGLGACAMLSDPVMVMLVLSIGALGIFGCLPPFWTLPTALLSGSAAAGGIALINSIGNLAGFVGPYAVGWVKESTGSFAMALLALAALPLAAGILVLAMGHDPALERREPAPAE
ncbi:MFS transporter [Roseicella sp. DB1501]|uniref:MFS transporter n=1 Tax=Roseicella sp. DB1501 TaxID=2730925 RepID=UPI00149096A4|nr:MFS transporter [Roseicella sp. DB1501]NOG74092.1 MFS transporter [Roseicella sp. DB1501]